MRPSPLRFSAVGPSGPIAFGFGVVLLAVAPLIRGGNRHVALILLEWLGLALLLVLAIQLQRSDDDIAGQPLPLALLFLALSPLWLALVQLVPLPLAVWSTLPGREIYVSLLSSVQASSIEWRPLSLAPDATWLSLLAGIPLSAAFLLALSSSPRYLSLLVRAVILIVSLQAVIGLLQVSLFRELYFGIVVGRVIGTFANPNHLANFIAMSLPLTVLFLRQSSQPARSGHRHARSSRRQHRSASSRSHGVARAAAPVLFGAALFVQLAALLMTASRAGIAVGVLSLLGAALLLPLRRISQKNWWWRLGAALGLLLLVGVTVGVESLVARIESVAGQTWAEDTRALLFVSTWQAAMAFWPFGSGLGTYAAVYPRFQPASISGFAEYAHSDFVQFFMECGAVSMVLTIVTLWLTARHLLFVKSCLRTNPADMPAALQASCALGLLAMLLHAWVDFSLHIPANAIVAIFLLGVLLRPSPGLPSDRG
jgi:hypothetical protein